MQQILWTEFLLDPLTQKFMWNIGTIRNKAHADGLFRFAEFFFYRVFSSPVHREPTIFGNVVSSPLVDGSTAFSCT